MDPQQTTAADTAASKDPTNIIVKGKRTKRQRPIILSHSSTSCNVFNSNSPASSSDFPASSTTTEDEDTANCLILLSKGHQLSPVSGAYKFNSKRYITEPAHGFTGIYVYECKTCSRTFPSFQALGGHRASHKKPRIVNELDKRKPPPYAAFSDDDETSPLFPSRKNNSSSSSSLSLQLNHRVSLPANTKKTHECSICGAEFNSGQALGGHMRRHRAANGNTTTTTTLSLIPVTPTVAHDQDHQKSRNDGLYLDLDLNLPAPQETTVVASNQDQHRESSLKFTANQNKQQPGVHLSATPTLVDCHY